MPGQRGDAKRLAEKRGGKGKALYPGKKGQKDG